jgi:hypothetical protein
MAHQTRNYFATFTKHRFQLAVVRITRFVRSVSFHGKIVDIGEEIKMNDPQNRFSRRNASRAAILRKDTEQAATRRQEVVAKQEARSARPRVGSMLLDELTAQAKRAADRAVESRRNEGPAAPQQLSPASIAAITKQWMQQHPEFYDSEFNAASMTAFVRKNVDAGVLFGMEIFDAGFAWLSENNHLERAPSTTRKRGEVVSAAAPTIFEYEPHEERQAREQLARDMARSIEDTEAERAKKMPFEELEREVKAGRKVQTRQQADGVVGAIR